MRSIEELTKEVENENLADINRRKELLAKDIIGCGGVARYWTGMDLYAFDVSWPEFKFKKIVRNHTRGFFKKTKREEIIYWAVRFADTKEQKDK